MTSLNSVLLEGTLRSDPVSSTLPEGTPVTAFDIVFTRGEEQGSCPVEAYSKLAEACAANLKAGRGIRVVGRLYNNLGTVAVIAEHVEFKPFAEVQ